MNEQPQNENNENTGQIQIEEKNTKKHENKDEKRKWHVRATVALLIIIIILLLLLLRQCSSGIPVLNPDYPPQQDESNAIVLPGDDDKLQDQEGGGMITVTNEGNVDVDVSFVYTQIETTVGGSFTDENNATVTSPIALDTGAQKNIKLALHGEPNEAFKSATLGTITVMVMLPEEQSA